ncbi:Acyl-coenzyme A synthetase ACSM4, mitochondrial, partial [Ophiophagus hannah]
MDEDGYFRFIGRADDIINSSGYRIGPFEVENVLLTHPAVAEVAAISSPDPIRGEVVKAFVVLSTDYATHNKEKLTMELQEHPQDVPEYFNFASDVLDKWSQREKEGKRPPNPAFWWIREKGEEVKWTFEDLSYLSRKTANVLSEASTILLTAPDILYRLQQSKVSCIVANEATAPLVDAVGSECSWLKTRILVSKSHKREGWLNFHDLLHQGSCIFQHGFFQFDPKVVLESLAKYPVTTFCGTPTIFRMLLQHNPSRYKFKSLHTCLGGGEPCNLDVLKEWKAETGFDIGEGYGQTESIIDENNNCLPPGEEGDIAVKIKPQRPVGLFTGYVNDPEKTAATERGDYYITGDRGLMDEEGYVQFVARADDIILSSGYRIGPFEVEHALMKHPAVAEAAVVSSPDPIRGEFEAINRGDKEVPNYFNFANDVLDKWSKIERDGGRPYHPALWWIDGKGGEVKWGFEKLGFVSRKAANVLTGPCGLQRGDRVILILPRIPEWWMLTLACIRAGIIFIPGTPQLTAKDIQYRLQVSKAKGIITNDSLAPVVETVSSSCPSLQTKAAPSSHNCVQTQSDEPMVIFFTSGTTGSPKMVEHSQTSLALGLTLLGRDWLDFKPSDIMWNISDTGWVKGSMGGVFGPWLRGTSVFIHSMPQFDPKEVLKTLSTYPVTTLCTAPTAYRMLVQQDLSSYTFKSLSHCLTGGEPMNPEVVSQWKKQTGLQLYEGYGQTEVKGKPVKLGSMGTAAPPYDVQVRTIHLAQVRSRFGRSTFSREGKHIIDEDGKILPRGQEGDIAIRIKPKRPFSFFSHYVDNPENNSAVVRGNFYITGDRGWMDEDGYFWFVGRSDDVIISSGYRIGPFEVESALIEHPAVVESAVVSSPDIFASHNPEKLTRELQDHVKKVTAPYKYPRKNFTDYKSICDQYKPEVPEYFNFAKDVVDNWAQSEKEGRRPSSPALWWVSEQGTQVEWSFVELALESKKAATVLSEQGGLWEGDRVVVILPRIPEWWLLNLACIRTEHTCVATKSTDPMAIYFTSGTTGAPKMTEHSHASHGIGLGFNGSQGAGIFVHHMPRFDPKLVLEMLSKFPITTFCSAPTVYRLLVQHNLRSYKFQNLKHCLSAGEPINPEVMDQWKTETGLDIYEGYGQTETDDQERTASTLRGDFYITGDRGFQDEDGYIWLVGRRDDVINSAGYRIGPFEVENALIEHDAVVEAAVVSSPDPIRGEVVKAFVVLAPEYISHDQEALIKELQDYVKTVTAPYKYPRKMEFVPHLPKTISGKIRRNELRKKEWGQA